MAAFGVLGLVAAAQAEVAWDIGAGKLFDPASDVDVLVLLEERVD